MTADGRIDPDAVHVVFVGGYYRSKNDGGASTNKRLLADSGQGCAAFDCGVQRLQDTAGMGVWDKFDGRKDSFYIYDAAGALEFGVHQPAGVPGVVGTMAVDVWPAAMRYHPLN